MARMRRPKPGQLMIDDPIAAEIRRAGEEHRQREEDGRAEFQRQWAERIKKELPPLLSSTRHEHSDACWTEPKYGIPYQPGVMIPTNIWYIQCRPTGVIKEVEKP